MFDNGVVGFRDPSGQNVESHWCCDGLDLESMAQAGVDISKYGYTIAPLWTDLINLGVDVDGDGQPDSGYFTNGDTNQMTYMWRNLAEYSDATRLNTFQLQIKPDGSYSVDYTAINIQDHSITVGAAGDLTNAHTSGGVGVDGVQQYHYATGYQSAIDGVLATFNNFATFCTTNALYDPTCPGYADAVAEQLFQQQCAADPLYDPQCTGYQDAYDNQQCLLDPLYLASCDGYEEALLLQQCALDPLYDSSCVGYDDAYFLQQCTADATYSPLCDGYSEAYDEQQCMYDPQYLPTCVGYIEPEDNYDGVGDFDFTEDDIIDDIVDTPDFSVPDFTGDTGIVIDGVNDVPEISIPDIEYNIMPDIPFELPETIEEQDFNSMMESFEMEIEMMDETIEEEIPVVEDIEVEDPRGDQIPENNDVTEEVVVIDEDGSEEEVVEEEVKNPFEKERDEKEIVEETGGNEDEQNDTIEEKVATVKTEKKPKAKEQSKTISKNEKLKILISKKAVELTKRVEDAVTIEQQMLVQRQLIALISFVPDFNYSDKKLQQVEFYPPQRTVDHQFARWFLNDPNFGAMEDLQYPQFNK